MGAIWVIGAVSCIERGVGLSNFLERGSRLGSGSGKVAFFLRGGTVEDTPRDKDVLWVFCFEGFLTIIYIHAAFSYCPYTHGQRNPKFLPL